MPQDSPWVCKGSTLHSRSMGIVGSRLSSSKGSEQGSGYFTIEREHISQARILPVKAIPGRPKGTVRLSSFSSLPKGGLSRRQSGKGPSKRNEGSGKAFSGISTWLAVMILSCGVAFISYLDRAIMGVAIIPMAAEQKYTMSLEGYISRYAPFIPMGRYL